MDEPEFPKIIRVVEEDLVTGKRLVKTGSVQVLKHTEPEVKAVDFDLLKEVVNVQRVPIGRVVDERPPIREVGDTIIVPVVEEEVVLSKRLVLREEVHLVRRQTIQKAQEEVTLNRESAEIRRLDAQGRELEKS